MVIVKLLNGKYKCWYLLALSASYSSSCSFFMSFSSLSPPYFDPKFKFLNQVASLQHNIMLWFGRHVCRLHCKICKLLQTLLILKSLTINFCVKNNKCNQTLNDYNVPECCHNPSVRWVIESSCCKERWGEDPAWLPVVLLLSGCVFAFFPGKKISIRSITY